MSTPAATTGSRWRAWAACGLARGLVVGLLLTAVFLPTFAWVEYSNTGSVDLAFIACTAVLGLVAGLLGGGPTVWLEARASGRSARSALLAGAAATGCVALGCVAAVLQFAYVMGVWWGGIDGGMANLTDAVVAATKDPNMVVGGVGGVLLGLAFPVGACVTQRALGWRLLQQVPVTLALAVSGGLMLLIGFVVLALIVRGDHRDGFDAVAAVPFFGGVTVAVGFFGLALLVPGVATCCVTAPLIALAARLAPIPMALPDAVAPDPDGAPPSTGPGAPEVDQPTG